MPSHAQLPLWNDKSVPEKLDALHTMILDLYRYHLQDAYRQIIADLTHHTPGDAKEAADVSRIIDLIREHPNILNQNCAVGHITASALILDLNKQRVLLHHHKSLNRWLQLGGHADYETRPADVALRECTEESGLTDLAFFPDPGNLTLIDVDVHTIPRKGNWPEHLHLDFRYLLTTRHANQVRAAEGESSRFMWLPVAEVESMQDKVDASLMRFLHKAKRLVETSRA
jgi:8-oxo-dGTP pyrophosphatase MutT (NUDIX family)